jgi:hypothetical protein
MGATLSQNAVTTQGTDEPASTIRVATGIPPGDWIEQMNNTDNLCAPAVIDDGRLGRLLARALSTGDAFEDGPRALGAGA